MASSLADLPHLHRNDLTQQQQQQQQHQHTRPPAEKPPTAADASTPDVATTTAPAASPPRASPSHLHHRHDDPHAHAMAADPAGPTAVPLSGSLTTPTHHPHNTSSATAPAGVTIHTAGKLHPPGGGAGEAGHDDDAKAADKLAPPIPTAEQVRRTTVVSLSVCLFYIVVSSSMVFANKALNHAYAFRTTNVLLLCQMVFTAALLRALRALRVLDFADLQYTRAKQVAPVSLFYSLNTAVALVALRELSVPSYTLIKRLAPLLTICLEAVVLRRSASRRIFASLLLMSAGTVLAANADASSTTMAWTLGFLSCGFQALYLVFVKRSGAETGMNSFGILYYHSLLSLPFMTAIALALGEFPAALAFPHWREPRFVAVFVASLFMGLLLNYALFLCTELTSPTSTVVSGQVKAMAQTFIGMFTFGGVELNTRYLFGTFLNISGGFGYAYFKLLAMRERGGSS